MLEGKSRAEIVFSEAWQQVAAGRSVDSVLADYPDCAAELEPMLRLSMRVRGLSALQPSSDALARIRRRAGFARAGGPLEEGIEDKVESRRVGGHPQTPGRETPAPPVGKVRTGGHPQAPGRGDPLHPQPIWRGKNWGHPQVPGRLLRASLSTGALLLLLIGAMIVSAALVLLMLNSSIDNSSSVVSYSGTITRLDGSVWQVDDMQVFIDDSTRIHGQPAVGAAMHCIAQPVGDNKMKAIEVWVGSAPASPTIGPGGPSDTGST